MTSLKTLKDLGYGLDSTEILENIKQEAIKWVKSLEEEIKVPNKKIKAGRITLWNLEIQRWIKHFFNLTEGDLK